MRLLLLASGTGSLVQAVIDGLADTGIEIVAVGSDLADAPVLQKARAADIEVFSAHPRDYADRAAWDQAFTETVADYRPDWVVSAGFMRILGTAFVSRFGGRIINTHPALLPSFPGAHGVRDALAYGAKVTGTTIHLVDEGVDTGPIIAQFPIAIEPDEDESALHERIKTIERRELVRFLRFLEHSTIEVSGRHVSGYTPSAS